jgi:hypothetical protein
MFRNTVTLLSGAVCAAGLSQFPEFAQQYTQRVGGAYGEIHAVAEGFRDDAAASGKTPEEALAEYRAAGTKLLSDRAGSVEKILARETYLHAHYTALTTGGGFNQLYAFSTEPDLELAEAAFGIYKPAMPLTFAGAAHAALGFLFGFALFGLGGRLFRRRRSNA